MRPLKSGIVQQQSSSSAPPVTGNYYISEDGADRYITEQDDILVQE